MNIKTILIVGISVMNLIGCSSSEPMLSKANTNKIVVDGNHEDWNGELKYFEDERAALGFQNDDENLYFCLVTSDKSNAMKIMSLGLTVWFKPQNDEQAMGLEYPKRMDKVAPQNLMGKNNNQNDNSDFAMTIKAMLQNQGEFLLVDDEHQIIYASPIGSNDGYEIKIGELNQQFVYEAKIPIGNNSIAPMPINIFPNEKISIEFETGKIDFEEMNKNNGAGMDQNSGMQGGGQGLRGDMQSGGRGIPSRMGKERFKLNVEVELAK